MSELVPNVERHREDGSGNVPVDLYSYHQTNYSGTVLEPWRLNPTTPELDVSGDVYTRWSKTMDDVVTPNWAKIRSQGLVVTNPMEMFLTHYNQGACDFSRNAINRLGTYPNYYYSGSRQSGTSKMGDLTSPESYSYPPPPTVDSSVIAQALTQAWANVSFNEAQVLQQLGEFRETISSLVSIFRRAMKIFRDVKKFRLKELTKEISPRELANRYMEARYALRPLMYDVKGTVKALNGEHKCSPRQTFRGYKRSVASLSLSDQRLYTSGGTAGYYINGSQRSERTLEVRAGILTSIDSQLLMNMNNWGIDEPFQTIWELIPFSFVVDWFCNVGDVIASWSPKFAFRILASWYVVTDTTTMSSTAETGVSTAAYNYENTISKTGTYSKVAVHKYRLPNPERPFLPSFKVNLNWWKTLDLGIILNQLVRFSRFF